MQMNTACLYSAVKNISGKKKPFSFLPPHGRELDVDEEVLFLGDIRENLGGNGGSEPAVRRRGQVAFAKAIENQQLLLLRTPSPVIQDSSTEDPKILAVSGGTLSAVDACYLNSV